MALHDAREQRTFVHVVEHRRELQGARQILDHFQFRRRRQFRQQVLVVQDIFAQTVRALFVELIALHRGQHRAKHFRPENVGEGVIALLREPQQQFTAGQMLGNQPRDGFLEFIDLAAFDEQRRGVDELGDFRTVCGSWRIGCGAWR